MAFFDIKTNVWEMLILPNNFWLLFVVCGLHKGPMLGKGTCSVLSIIQPFKTMLNLKKQLNLLPTTRLRGVPTALTLKRFSLF